MKEIIKEFKNLSSKHGLWEVFNDFLMFSAIMISNSCDKARYEEREREFITREKNYSKEEMQQFSKIFVLLLKELEENTGDILGQLFMELELSSKWKGQFFTPYNVAKLAADLTINKEDIDRQIKSKGYFTANDCCSGGGVMLIAVAQRMKELGYNYQKQLLVTAQDLDIKSVYMTYIQLSALGVPAIVYHQNSLSLETYNCFKSPFYILQAWKFSR